MSGEAQLTKQDLHDFLDSQLVCVISTQGDDGYPNSATVAFSSTKDLRFFIMTSEKSRKARNMARNGKVAITVSDESKRWTVQLEGNATAMEREEFNQKYGEGHYNKLPQSLPYKDIPDQVAFIIVPVHLRLSDVGVRPWRVVDFV